MHGSATCLLLLAAANCLIILSPASAEKSSEAEDDDWEEHHDEYTYTELDDNEESREGGLENTGYDVQNEGSTGSYSGAASSGSKKARLQSASQVGGATKSLKASSKQAAKASSAKGKRKKAADLGQQSSASKTKHVTKTSQLPRKPSRPSKSETSLKKSAPPNAVHPGREHARKLTMIVKRNPKIWPSGVSPGDTTFKGRKSRAYKWNPKKQSKFTKETALKKTKSKKGKELRKNAIAATTKGFSSKTSSGRRKRTLNATRASNSGRIGKKRGATRVKSKTKRVTAIKNEHSTKRRLPSSSPPPFSNPKKSNKSRLREFAEKAIGVIWPAVKNKFGFKKGQGKKSAQNLSSSPGFSSKPRNRFGTAKVRNGSKKGQASSVTINPGGRKKAAHGSSAVKSENRRLGKGQSGLDINRTSSSSLRSARGEERSRHYERGFLGSSRRRRKKGLSILRVRRIRRRRRKNRSRKRVVQLRSVEQNSSPLEPNNGALGKDSSKPERGGSRLQKGSDRHEQGTSRLEKDSRRFEKGDSRRERGSRHKEDGVRLAQNKGRHENGSSQLEHRNDRLDQNGGQRTLKIGQPEKSSSRHGDGGGRLEQYINPSEPVGFQLNHSSDRVPSRQTVRLNFRRKPRKVDRGSADLAGETDPAPRHFRAGNENPRTRVQALPKKRTKKTPEIKEHAVRAQNLPSLSSSRPKTVAPKLNVLPKRNLPVHIPKLTEVVPPWPDVPEHNPPAPNLPRTNGATPRPGAVPAHNLPGIDVPLTETVSLRPDVVPDDNQPFLSQPHPKDAIFQPHAVRSNKEPVLNPQRIKPVAPHLEITRDGSVLEKTPLPLRKQKLERIPKTPDINSTTVRRRRFPTPAVNASNTARRPLRGVQKASDTVEPVVPQRSWKRHREHRRHRCQGGSSPWKGKAGKIVGGGLMWFPAASCAAAGLDWNSVHSTACLHQQIAFVHRYKVLTPALHPVSEEYQPGFCGSYVPWNHVAPHHVTDLVYDGSIVSGLSLHRFGFVNPGGYTFELLPHTGRLILVGVPFHRRALSLCHLDSSTLGLLFTGTGLRNGALGMQRLGQICGTLETYIKTKPSSFYWGFPTVPVRTAPVAVRVPDASTEAVTPVLPIASDSAEEFTLKVFTEPLTLYPEVPIDYSETHTNFLEPVMFVTEPIERVVRTRVESVSSPVIGTASETVAETVLDGGGGGVSPVIETHEVHVVHPAVQTVHEDVHVIAGPEVAMDALPSVAQAANAYSDIEAGVNDVAYHTDFDVDEPGTSYYLDFAEPVVHMPEQVLCFPGPGV